MRFLSFAALALLAPSAAAQTILHEFSCPTCDRGSVTDIAAVGDVTGDGTPDVAIAYSVQVPRQAVVRVHSGADGAIEREWVIMGLATAQIAGGDVDADGWSDVVVGTPLEFNSAGQGGVVRVFSGRTSAELLRFDGVALEFLGFRVASGLDVNGDGHDDVIALAEGCIDPIVCNVGVVYVFSGDGGALLYSIPGTDPGSLFGYGLDGVGDLDGDGRDDFLISDAAVGYPGPGIVMLIDGDDGSTIRSIASPTGQTWFGRDADGVGDVTGDGVPDIAVTTSASGPDPDRVDVFSGADGSLRWTQLDPSSSFGFYGNAVAGIPDATGDGVPDVVVAARLAGSPVGQGAVYLYSGADGALQNVVRGESSTQRLGSAIDGVEDLDGDGLAEILVAIQWDVAQSGVAGVGRVLSGGALRALDRSCVGAPNSVGPGAQLAFEGTQSLVDDDLVIAADGLPPNTFALLVRGVRSAMLPLGDGYLCVDPFTPGLTRLQVIGADAAGSAAFDVDLASPAAPAAGESWTFQVLYRDALPGGSGMNGSDALTATFVP